MVPGRFDVVVTSYEMVIKVRPYSSTFDVCTICVDRDGVLCIKVELRLWLSLEVNKVWTACAIQSFCCVA